MAVILVGHVKTPTSGRFDNPQCKNWYQCARIYNLGHSLPPCTSHCFDNKLLRRLAMSRIELRPTGLIRRWPALLLARGRWPIEVILCLHEPETRTTRTQLQEPQKIFCEHTTRTAIIRSWRLLDLGPSNQDHIYRGERIAVGPSWSYPLPPLVGPLPVRDPCIQLLS